MPLPCPASHHVTTPFFLTISIPSPAELWLILPWARWIMEIEMHCNPKFLNPSKDINPKTAIVEVLIEHLPNIIPLMAIHLHNPLPRHPCTPFIYPLVSSHDPLTLNNSQAARILQHSKFQWQKTFLWWYSYEQWLLNMETLPRFVTIVQIRDNSCLYKLL